MTARRLSTLMLAMLALVLIARPAAAEVPETAVSEKTALMVWVDMTIVDADMIAKAGDMLADLGESPMLGGLAEQGGAQGLPLTELDLSIIQMQDFRDAFTEAGGEGMLLMMAMPTEGEQMPGMSAMVKVGEDADIAALQDAMAGLMDGTVVEMDEYADGWLAAGIDGSLPPTADGKPEDAAHFNAHLAERAEAPITIVFRMDDDMREMIDGMMLVEDPQMAMLAGMIQPLRGMDTAALSVFVDEDDAVEIDVAMAFGDKQLGSEFLNSFNGILMLAQGMLGMQMAELNNPPSQEAIAGFFQGLAMQSEDGGETLRMKLGQDFFEFAEELGPAFEEMMGQMQGEGQLF